MRKRFVLVAGNISSGKTSLTERLGKQLGWQTAYESVVDNPYLADFYGDMGKWGFHLQVFFLGNRADQHVTLANMGQHAIIDRSIYEDAEIFSRALVSLGNMSDRDYQTYRTIFDLVVSKLPAPDLLIYLKAPIPVLMERISNRGREMERGITAEYLGLLEEFYTNWIAKFDLCPVLKLAGKEEVQFK
jgi:deoxyadenosine/deoxycytidine kinase